MIILEDVNNNIVPSAVISIHPGLSAGMKSLKSLEISFL